MERLSFDTQATTREADFQPWALDESQKSAASSLIVCGCHSPAISQWKVSLEISSCWLVLGVLYLIILLLAGGHSPALIAGVRCKHTFHRRCTAQQLLVSISAIII